MNIWCSSDDPEYTVRPIITIYIYSTLLVIQFNFLNNLETTVQSWTQRLGTPFCLGGEFWVHRVRGGAAASTATQWCHDTSWPDFSHFKDSFTIFNYITSSRGPAAVVLSTAWVDLTFKSSMYCYIPSVANFATHLHWFFWASSRPNAMLLLLLLADELVFYSLMMYM